MNSLSAPILYPTDFPIAKGITHIIDKHRSDSAIIDVKGFLSGLDAHGLTCIRNTDTLLRSSP